MPEVTWLPIPAFPGYSISSLGQVRHQSRDLKPQPRGGYLRVRLVAPDGKRVWRPVHTLVLEAFVGPRPSPKHHGAHTPDNDRSRNSVDNLAWKLPSENEADKRACGTAPRGGCGDLRGRGLRECARELPRGRATLGSLGTRDCTGTRCRGSSEG